MGGMRLAAHHVPNPFGRAVLGGTYFPPEPRWAAPLPQVLAALGNAYRGDRDTVLKNVAALREGLTRLGQPSAATAARRKSRLPSSTASPSGCCERSTAQWRHRHAPKFPQSGIFELLWRAWKRTGREPYREAVLRTLATISQGASMTSRRRLCRYATDARWLVPISRRCCTTTPSS